MKQKDIDYINEKGLDTIRKHAEDFIAKREAPAYIPNDGKQTPMRGHPVFIAQHATATCCRECIRKWHKIQLFVDTNAWPHIPRRYTCSTLAGKSMQKMY